MLVSPVLMSGVDFLFPLVGFFCSHLSPRSVFRFCPWVQGGPVLVVGSRLCPPPSSDSSSLFVLSLRAEQSSSSREMKCRAEAVSCLSWVLVVGGAVYLWHQTRSHTEYGRYAPPGSRCCSARLGWFLQEVPSFLLPLLLQLLTEEPGGGSGRTLLLCTFMLHYFHRSFIYAFLTRGRPVPLIIVVSAAIFCSLNGFLQGHHLLHCTQFEHTWLTDARLAAGFLLFAVGMSINIHSDYILRSLRRPGEVVYRIPYGGMFEFVSGANFFGEIVEWCGYAVAVWSLPAFAFAFFTICSIGPRAYQHHRDYLKKFELYPRSRKAIIPFLL